VAKQTAVGSRFYLDTYDLSGDVGALSTIASTRALQEVTALQSDSAERLLLRSEGVIGFNGWFNSSTTAPALRTNGTAAGTVDHVATWANSATRGDVAGSLVGKQMSYPITIGEDGSLVIAAELRSNGAPVEWGVQLTAGKDTFSSSGTSASTDLTTASLAFGASAYLHAISIASGTATVAVQDSADNSTFANVTGLTWTVSAAGASRTATGVTATTRRYWRVNCTGTFTNLVAVVTLHRFLTAQT